MSIEVVFVAIYRKGSYGVYFCVFNLSICLPWSSKVVVMFLILRISWMSFLFLIVVFCLFVFDFASPQSSLSSLSLSVTMWLLSLKQDKGGDADWVSLLLSGKPKQFRHPGRNLLLEPISKGSWSTAGSTRLPVWVVPCSRAKPLGSCCLGCHLIGVTSGSSLVWL